MYVHIGFVDDCNQQTNQFSLHPQPAPNTLDQLMQHDVQRWSNLLWSSGGMHELPKCSHYVIHTEFTPSGLPILANTQSTIPLTVQSAQISTPPTIKCLSFHQLHKTLGYWLNPAGSMRKQLEVTTKKSDHLTDIVSCSTLSATEVWTFYFEIYLPGVGYTLPMSMFTELECHTIQQRFISTALPKCRVNWNSARSWVYGPQSRGGLGFRHLYQEQGIRQVLMALKHMQTPGQPNQMLKIALTWAQAKAGTSRPLWVDVTTPFRPG